MGLRRLRDAWKGFRDGQEPADRDRQRRLIAERWVSVGSAPQPARRPDRPTGQRVTVSAEPGAAPISVIVPLRNRAGEDVRNALASLRWQTAGAPFETILVSHGSEAAIDARLEELARDAGATLITVGRSDDPWCKPLALNTGIRATEPSVPFVMVMDADMILAENFVETVLHELGKGPYIVLCRSSDLPRQTVVPSDTDSLRGEFEALRERARLRPQFGTGGIQAVDRRFLVEARGYDEDMLWWGSADTDLVRRAELAGRQVSWISTRTAMLHQWHPRKEQVLEDEAQREEAAQAWKWNHLLLFERGGTIVRNPDGWGARLVD